MSSQSKLRFRKELNELIIADIQFLISNRIEESQNLEYKRPTDEIQMDCDNLSQIISSFLNTDGGIIVFGIAETDGVDHFPAELKWTTHKKERLENLLLSRIQPWNELIKIFRIEKKEAVENGIFVIEVPKSNNSPHMHNHRYYQRLNYQSKPMEHENVYRSFQTSWIRKKELSENVLEPIYAEIKSNFDLIENLKVKKNNRKFNRVISEKVFLYDQLSPSLRKKIADFYSRLVKLDNNKGWADAVAREIINAELTQTYPEWAGIIEKTMGADILRIKVIYRDPAGRTQTTNNPLNRALLLKKEPQDYLESIHLKDKILNYEPFVQTAVENRISDESFKNIWIICNAKALKNRMFISIWRETSRLLKLGKEIVGSIKENRI